jgi:radical SAM superfamily enzyme YgiQ (UPF0313 family)
MEQRRAEKYDFAYISVIFRKNGSEARKLAKQFPEAVVSLGGSGVSLSTILPEEIENIFPDYDLYPECDFSLGYTSRGCPRSCGYCLVPKMKYEGRPHAVCDIYRFYDQRFKKMVILDNNIFSVPNNHFKRISKQIIKEGIKVEFNAGLDIRFIDDEKAKLLREMHIKVPKFAWDDIRDESLVGTI